jgi:hypothetical protein
MRWPSLSRRKRCGLPPRWARILDQLPGSWVHQPLADRCSTALTLYDDLRPRHLASRQPADPAAWRRGRACSGPACRPDARTRRPRRANRLATDQTGYRRVASPADRAGSLICGRIQRRRSRSCLVRNARSTMSINASAARSHQHRYRGKLDAADPCAAAESDQLWSRDMDQPPGRATTGRRSLGDPGADRETGRGGFPRAYSRE